ncbi:protein LLP homolog [Argiope bruennichi]|uniref:Protein LLP like protein n=1 Tax=Argiope bruennichi TaxID=94029 RepID=A0A8T0G111_ARGBR|nr:protein LLP homolog [Argiope bruennichi]XP_055932132.1 protein LLP homolog [Argiope bruennichi]KAF8794853.1 Protein LLP like protein [Argiope bruennichi]
MAKSLRSKWRRKMRAIKRERYAVKELKQLKNILENSGNKDADMSEICTVLDKKDIQNLGKKDPSENNEENVEATVESSSMDVDQQSSKYHPKRLTDEHGTYPVWMNQRQIRKHKAKLNRVHKKAKKNKKRN